MHKSFLVLAIFFIIPQFILSQSIGDSKKWAKEYKSIKNPEISLNDYLKLQQRKAKNQAFINLGKTKLRKRTASYTNSDILCSIGDFETLNSLNQYFSGGWTDYPGLPLDYNLFVANLSTDLDISSANSRQTIVTTSMQDPTIIEPLQTTNSGNRAIRLGNNDKGHGVESMSVDINVSSPIITFWYAIVMHDPSNHTAEPTIPYFEVRVISENGSIINNAVNLGGGSNRLQSNNQFLKPATAVPGYTIRPKEIKYKPWACAQINLGQYIGQNVTIQFVNSDCSEGGHMSYTYIDDISSCGECEDSPTGTLIFNQTSTDCALGKICFDYSLPDNGRHTGEININLEVHGSNNNNQTYNSGVLNSGNSYCFTLPSEVFGNSYDFVGVADFTLNGLNVNTLNTGAWPNGQVEGTFNDCSKNKPSYNFMACCPPLSKEEMVSFFTPEFKNGANGPYQMVFKENQSFKNKMQAFTDLLKETCGLTELGFAWQLCDMGDGENPTVGYCGKGPIEEEYFHFIPGENGVIQNPVYQETGFFNNDGKFCQPNHWYRIRTGIWPENGREGPENCFDYKNCPEYGEGFEFRWQTISSSSNARLSTPKLEIR